MRKAYVTDNRDLPSNGGPSTSVEVYFTLNPEHARPFTTQGQAQQICRELDSYNIHVSWAEGGDYLCKNFQVEQNSAQQFVVFCEGPFTLTVEAA
jgi:hypothetical protein